MLAARTGLSPVMIGRSGALARLQGLLGERRPDGLPSVALVTGEPGVGKTRLLQELLGGLPAGTAVLAGAAEPGALGRPYEVVRAMLEGPLPPVHGEELRHDVVAAIEERLGDGPAVAVFEDLHWADAESVAVLDCVAAGQLPQTLIIITSRPEELTRRLPGGEMLERLERRQFVHHVHIDRLGREEVGTFLATVYGKMPPSAVVDALYGRTGGNPFFLEEILNVAGDVDPAELDRQPLPWSLAELVRTQLDGLSSEERRIVEAAAVLGRKAEFDLLAVATRTSEDELIAHLRALVERGLLLEECEDSFIFRHALVRDAVEGQLLGRERRRLHEVALAALRESPSEDLAALAHHARGAGRFDEFVALAREGVGHYLAGGSSHQALRLAADALTEAPDDVALLAAASRAAWLLGLHDEALIHAERWHRVVRTAPAPERAAAARMLARVYHELARTDDMWRIVLELEALVDELEPGEDRALVMAWIAQLTMLNYRSNEAIEWADRAIAEADAVGAKGVRAQALVERASALYCDQPGSHEDALAAFRVAIAEAEAVEDWVLVARAINNMSKYLSVSGMESENYLTRLREASERAGYDGMGKHSYRYRLVELAVARGNLAEARRELNAAFDATGLHLKGWHYTLEAVLSLEEGRFDVAADAIDRAEPAVRLFDKGGLQSLRLKLAALRRNGREAARLVAEMTDDAVDEVGLEAETIFERLEAAARLGLVDDAPKLVARWSHRVPSNSGHFTAAAEGLVAALEGRAEEAIAVLEPAVDDRSFVVPAYQRSWVRLVLARCLAGLGRRHGALEAARAAQQELAQWPGWRRDEIDALVRRLEGGAGDGESELTSREREVAGLLAEGLSNAELARRLYISPKTAAVHVSNILMKLGMSSRAEVAAWAVRTGLAKEVSSGR
ncbi:MAG TPA: LuxR C-terminal-related transcriptional regulator [Acidimicrobiales bacterium]|nr:LuxR C-terminal-related transcriptional regulator [Acidimicrobiales bacterium]